MKRIRVLFRIWLRAVVRFLSGRRFTVLLPDPRKVMLGRIRELMPIVAEVRAARQNNNRVLLTDMVVALIAGPNIIPWSGWERYKNAARPRSYFRGVPYRIIGRPSVVKYPNNVVVGMTDWLDAYTPRAEVLAARRAK